MLAIYVVCERGQDKMEVFRWVEIWKQKPAYLLIPILTSSLTLCKDLERHLKVLNKHSLDVGTLNLVMFPRRVLKDLLSPK